MLGITSGSELFRNRRNQTAKKKKEMPCEFRLNYLSMKMAQTFQLKKSNFDLT